MNEKITANLLQIYIETKRDTKKMERGYSIKIPLNSNSLASQTVV